MATDEIPTGYNTPVPSKILTPDRVSSRLGPLDFTDGVPSAQTAQKLFDNLDHLRAVEVFLNCVPAASIEALRLGFADVGVDACHKMLIMDTLLNSEPLFLTGNADTVYCGGFLDLEKDGPTVVEIPPGCGPGTVNDAWFRFVIDMGGPGPDRGQGGKYLILPPGYEGDVPDGYFVARSRSFSNWIILRGFLVDGKPDASATMFKEGVKIYPLSHADHQPPMEFHTAEGRLFNTVHANDASYYEELAPVIHREPIDMIDPETRGLLAAIGIHKDRPFEPDERMKAILVDAAAVANATARALYFRWRTGEARIYDDRSWHTYFIGGDYQWLRDEGRGGRYMDARTFFFYMATVNTPAMALKIVGAGSQYAGADVDAAGDFLEGSGRYRLNLPAGVPAKNFWSICVYDPQTRSELQTGQRFPSLNNTRDPLQANGDGSIDILFGPDEPTELSTNWIQTVPGKGWFVVLRLYGPLDGWFDQTWRPGDVECIGG
ncbi:DUF1254 domain-containing protein [Demequina aurantiaca]|uniref:DUF1254 domain-containing protein n=1 Tax=Demequina aurantiaca TaxID=676200 RepID=UPI000A7B5D50|nr:DUF1254 domain-containing protein [Demequina aurantiaca]